MVSRLHTVTGNVSRNYCELKIIRIFQFPRKFG